MPSPDSTMMSSHGGLPPLARSMARMVLIAPSRSLQIEQAIRARFVTPDSAQNARKRFDDLKQGHTKIRTLNERFNAALQFVLFVPGDDGGSASSAAHKYLQMNQISLRESMSLTLRNMSTRPLAELQSHAFQCATDRIVVWAVAC